MEIIHADTYWDAWEQAQDRRARDVDGALHCKIVKSVYGGYSVVVMERELMADMLLGEAPMIPTLKNAPGPLDFPD